MKRIHIFAAVLGIAGFVLILGTAGASDNGYMAFGEIVLRCIIGLALLTGAYAAERMKEEQTK